MQKEVSPSQEYEFEFRGGINNSYFFETDKEIFYEVRFTPTDYLFDNKLFDQYTYEFSIIVSDNPTHKNPTFDIRTSHTIASIFRNFYEKSDKYLTIYICDSSDQRQLIRHRKFQQWFLYFTNDDFLKMDAIIKDENHELFPVSIIFKETNPYKIEISAAFLKLIEGYNRGK